MADARSRQIARRDILAVLLTLTTGAIDAVTFLHLGLVFSSVITGNMALLGVAAGSRNAALAVNGGLALGGYAAGAMAGGLIARTPTADQPVWPRRVTIALAAELAVLAGFSAGWVAASGRPAGVTEHVLLALAAVAMGMQSAAVRRLGPMSTTYMTSTLTGAVVALALRRPPGEQARTYGILAAFVVGAVIGAVVAAEAASWAPVPILVPIVAVAAVAVRR